jgi:hypothetical protein
MTTLITLWYYIDGSSTIFKIETKETDDISVLKKLIKKENPNGLDRTDAGNLILWKVRHSHMRDDHDDTQNYH